MAIWIQGRQPGWTSRLRWSAAILLSLPRRPASMAKAPHSPRRRCSGPPCTEIRRWERQVVSISLSANPTPKDLVGGRTGTLNWTLQNSTGVRANKLTLAMLIDNRFRISSSIVTGSNSSDPVSCGAPIPGDPGTNIAFCNIDYLGGSFSGSGGSTTVYATAGDRELHLAGRVEPDDALATGYLSFDGTDSSNPVARGQVRVK